MKVPFAIPDITPAEVEAVSKAVASGWLTSGKITREFEEDFEKRLPGVGAVAVNSATAGLHLVLEALGVGPGDEVIVPTLTFTATAEVVRYMGATPVLCDVDSETGCMTLEGVQEVQSEKTVGIIPVHFAGAAMDLSALTLYARKRNWFVVEDAAHAIGAIKNGVEVGLNDTDATVFSFYATKCITTGEGGMVLSRNQRIVQRARVMRLHGIDRDVFDRYQSSKPAWMYDIIAPGFKYNMTDVAAAMGRVQLGRIAEMQEKRQKIAARYDSELGGHVSCPGKVGPEEHVYHLYQIGVKDRDTFIADMFKAGVGCSVHFRPLHTMEYWSRHPGSVRSMYRNAEKRYASMVSIPIYSAMTEEQIDYVIEQVKIATGSGRLCAVG